jgi:two-component system nitrate/nitrite response regulator NarL
MYPNRLRVLIIDGHPAVGRGLKALVNSMPGLKVVGLACLVVRGLRQARQAAPDVALVDADLPGLCSLAAIALLKCRLPRIRVVALGIYPERRRASLLAGADDFVLKDAGYDALQAAINGNPTTDSNSMTSENDARDQAASQDDATRQRERVAL